MIIDREWGINDHLHDLVDLLEKVGGWLNSRTQPLTPPLNFGSLNTVVDRRSDEQRVGGIMAQIEQRIRRLMVFGGVYGEEKFKNSKRKKYCKSMHFY